MAIRTCSTVTGTVTNGPIRTDAGNVAKDISSVRGNRLERVYILAFVHIAKARSKKAVPI